MKRKKFRQRLVASAEGPFTTVCLITRPARRRESSEVLRHQYRKLRLCLDFWPIPNRGLSLTGRVVLHKVLSSQVV